jgi:hypothetical protein
MSIMNSPKTLMWLTLLTSIALFLFSLTQECFCTTKECSNSITVLIAGAIGFIFGGAPITWLANPALLLSWIFIKWKPKVSLLMSLLATFISLSFLHFDKILVNEGGTMSDITGYRLGYWLWVCSSLTMLIGNIVMVIKSRKTLEMEKLKKIFSYILVPLILYSCSTSNPSDPSGIKQDYKDVGILVIGFGSSDSVTINQVVRFYKTPESAEPVQKIKLDYELLDSLFRDSPQPYNWFSPFEFMPTPGWIFFRCLQQKGNWYQVLTNDSQDVAYWVKKDTNIELINWLDYFKGGHEVEIGSALKTSPKDDASVIEEDSWHHLYDVDTLVGEWLKVTTSDYRVLNEDTIKIEINTGWTKWRNRKSILVIRHYNE